MRPKIIVVSCKCPDIFCISYEYVQITYKMRHKNWLPVKRNPIHGITTNVTLSCKKSCVHESYKINYVANDFKWR